MLSFQYGSVFALRLRSQCDVASTNLTIRGATKEGPFTFAFVTGANSTITSQNFNIPDVPIFAMVIDNDGMLYQGDCYVTLDLMVNDDQLYHLGSGLVYTQKKMSWPPVSNQDQRPGGGIMIRFLGTDPAANVEITQTVPSGEVWKVRSIAFTLVSDGNAANRFVTLTITDGTNTILQISPAAVQTATQTVRYNFAPNLSARQNATTLIQEQPLPADLILPAGSVISTVTTARQATDNFGAPYLQVEKFFESD